MVMYNDMYSKWREDWRRKQNAIQRISGAPELSVTRPAYDTRVLRDEDLTPEQIDQRSRHSTIVNPPYDVPTPSNPFNKGPPESDGAYYQRTGLAGRNSSTAANPSIGSGWYENSGKRYGDASYRPYTAPDADLNSGDWGGRSEAELVNMYSQMSSADPRRAGLGNALVKKFGNMHALNSKINWYNAGGGGYDPQAMTKAYQWANNIDPSKQYDTKVSSAGVTYAGPGAPGGVPSTPAAAPTGPIGAIAGPGTSPVYGAPPKNYQIGLNPLQPPQGLPQPFTPQVKAYPTNQYGS